MDRDVDIEAAVKATAGFAYDAGRERERLERRICEQLLETSRVPRVDPFGQDDLDRA